MDEHKHWLEIATEAAIKAGKVLKEFQGKINAKEKGPKDLVTEADLTSQEVIREYLQCRLPSHDFLGEEDPAGLETILGKEFAWIVDPLDGTANYVHGLPFFSISIALLVRGEPKVSVIFDPISYECFSAIDGQGAWLNDSPIRVSSCTQAEKAMAAASFSTTVSRDSEQVARFLSMLFACQVVRRLGSAALNLAYLACGRLDTYFATSVKLWDIAGGVLIVKEAGGVLHKIDGTPLYLADPRFVASATQELQSAVLRVM